MSKQKSGNNPEVFSELSMTLESADPNDFYLRPPEKNNKDYLKCKIFFFNTPQFIEIEISQHDLAKDVIRHIITLYKKSPKQEKIPIEFPQNPERYELWLIDEYESEYSPDTDIGPRAAGEEIGEFTSLAFMKKKSFMKSAETAQADLARAHDE